MSGSKSARVKRLGKGKLRLKAQREWKFKREKEKRFEKRTATSKGLYSAEHFELKLVRIHRSGSFQM